MSVIDASDEPVLPFGFRWEKASQHEEGPPTALTLDGVEIARMMDKVAGGWFVLLERQRPSPPGEPFAPLVTRDCSSFEQGRRGTAMWATRHEVRIRSEVAARIAANPRHLGAGR
ncbi:hypothetical protein [Xanthomonas citri]|uniref:Uncharacterized protein n=1 Tax=Xanthomonas citri pv. citri TaxID=611301 RepID=A0A0U5FA57_XANCI|nr:hypothetical protein [Xanthomonas citri]CEG15242.1 conserved hypothetical protein [Xanthomonas citri pv. citri]CEH58400.1 conserved hypothetical protein [Xanthomonas citri pv. citri]CEH89093.1 conserved hypothetical protein [Xanthomonas citri pv. citri]CEH89801.1 conserved hypothetical protein [Xanthomonas citri pv. citri]CEJ22422.1 conserved hypothetical protein [Xanthomonas citri pv. citri]